MSNVNKCRVCLADGANLPIFENIENKKSVHSKLFQCFKEMIEDIEGYPRNICKQCNVTLHTVCDFITRYKTSCKLLESNLIVVKKEACSDNDSVDQNYFIKDEILEFEICKNEVNPNWEETLDDALWDTPLPHVKTKDTNLTKIKAKLKSLKEINFKKKPTQSSKRKTGRVASSILEAEFDWNGESLKSNKLKEPKEETLIKKPKFVKLSLPKPKCPKPPPPSLCDICGKVFKTYSRMIGHKKDKHINQPVKCPKCPRSSRLYSQYYLNLHIARIHSERKFICDTCGSGFAWKGGLNTHIRKVHSKLKKKMFECEKCNKFFTNAKSYTIHERSVHTGLRPAECTICGARFYHEEYLQEHVRLHTGETPFKCPICGRGYAQRGNMKSHIAHNHRLTDLTEEQIKNLKPSWFKYLKKP